MSTDHCRPRAGEVHGKADQPALHRVRIGVAAVFFLVGVVSATWVARMPALKHDLGLGDAQLAIAFVGLNAGAIIGLQAGGLLVPRLGSRTMLRLALPAFACSLVPLALAPNLIWLTAAWVFAAATNGVVDVAMNVQGLAVEQESGRPRLAGFHGMHPLGGILGAGLGVVAASLGIGPTAHFAVVAIVVAVAALGATMTLQAAPIGAAPARPEAGWDAWRRGWTRRTVGLGLLAFCVTLAEGSTLDWGAIYLRDGLGASATLAAGGATLFLAGVAGGRFLGDRVILWWGAVAAFRRASLVAVTGASVLLLAGAPALGLVGLVLLGAGISYLLPLLFRAAGGTQSETASAGAVARISTLGYLGSFTGPAVIGGLAGAAGLRAGLVVPLALLILTTAAAGMLRPPPDLTREQSAAT